MKSLLRYIVESNTSNLVSNVKHDLETISRDKLKKINLKELEEYRFTVIPDTNFEIYLTVMRDHTAKINLFNTVYTKDGGFWSDPIYSKNTDSATKLITSGELLKELNDLDFIYTPF